MTTPKVSFIVLCYNTEQYVPECIESILAMSGEHDFEIIALDDCSTDRTLAALRTFRDPRLRVIAHPANMGHAISIGDLLGAARAPYIARIDSDDRYHPAFLNEVVPILDQNPEVGLVYADACLIDSAGNCTEDSCDRVHSGRDFKGRELIPLLHHNFICAPTIIARRELWLKMLPVPSFLAFHDWYFTVLIARESEFYYRNRVLAGYRVHPGNLHSKITLNRTEEPSLLWMLDQVFGTSEASAEREREKQGVRNAVYAIQYWTLANKYFGAKMMRDARRCYLKAAGHSPAYLFKPGLLRRLCATFAPHAYETSKAIVRRIGAPLTGKLETRQ